MRAKKVIIPVSIILGVAAIGVAVVALGRAAAGGTYADTVRITQKELENTVSVSGTISSASKKNVYSRLSYPVDTINVEVGDSVKKGDVLCTINTEDLQQQILQQQASVDSSGVNSDYQLSEAERRYNDALADYQNGKNTAVINAQKMVDQAEKNLEDAKRQERISSDLTQQVNVGNADTQIKSASSQLDSAKLNYDNALKAYNDAEDALKPENYPIDVKNILGKMDEYNGYYDIVRFGKYNAELETAKSKFDEAQKKYYNAVNNREQYSDETFEKINDEYVNAKTEYEAMKKKYDKDTLEDQVKAYQDQLDIALDNLKKVRDNAKTSLDNAQITLNNAQLAYDKAVSDYDTTSKQNDNTGESYSIAVKNAEDALENAKRDYDLTIQQVESELATLKKSAEQQRTVSGLNDPQVIMLQNYKDRLEYAVITAPCDGIVTAVNAEEGAAAAGVLFVIEDLENLKITASVGEYDIPYVNEGMEAVIRCDALNREEFAGKVTSVAPTSVMSANGAASYKIEASIDSKDDRLLAGMSAKLNIISERKAGALTVTYDALAVDEKGNDIIYIAEKGDDGTYRAKLVQVKIGLETDYEIEVIADGLKEGMLVLTNTATLIDGAVVMIDESEALDE
ncbi:MAG: efflux RND transporter periplasmic adaptor subunit [Oscillospiraceae bacterium]|nr:efflux RND transporter periplasmic adaptor subunit [Oscillospiraceae bacterium]